MANGAEADGEASSCCMRYIVVRNRKNVAVKVRDVFKALEADGWRLVTVKGDHRQFKHHSKPGKVTVAGHLGVDGPPGTLASIFRQA